MSRGGRAERNVAIAILASWTLSLIAQDHELRGVDLRLAAIDVIMCAILILMSVRNRKPWILLLAAAQLDTVIVHCAQLWVGFDLYPYAVALGLLSGIGQLPILAWGVIQHRVDESRRWSAQSTATQSIH